MVCSNCGNSLKENEKFCTLCGTYNDGSDSQEEEIVESKKNRRKREKEQETAPMMIPQDRPMRIEKPKEVVVEEYIPRDDPAVVAYIGEDYKWIAERPFNIYALLLSWIYFLYRKQYLIGIIGLIVTGVIYKYFSFIIVPYIVLSMVGCGLTFNKFYLDLVEKKVEKIKRNAKELDDVEAICKRKGGVNVIAALIIFLIFLAVMLSSYLNINFQNKVPQYWEETSENTANCKSLCREIYTKNQVPDTKIEEMACEVTKDTTGGKMYNIYIKYNKNGDIRYVYYQNNSDGYRTQKGDTDLIPELEAHEKDLTEHDKEFLDQSRLLANKFSSLRSDSNHDDELIKKYQNTAPKTHFYFTQENMFK